MVSDREEVYIPGSSFHQAEGSESRPANHYYLLLFAERLQLLRKRAKDHIECLFSDLHRSIVSDSRPSTPRIELLKASVRDVVYLVRSNRHELARSQASPREPGRHRSRSYLGADHDGEAPSIHFRRQRVGASNYAPRSRPGTI